MSSNKNTILSKLDNVLRKMKLENNYTVSAGWFNANDAKIAAIMEYGAFINVTKKQRYFLAKTYGIYVSKNTLVIPPRPHRQQTWENNKSRWIKAFTDSMNNNLDVEIAVNQLGLIMMQDYKQIIKGGDFKPLSAATMHIRQQTGIAGSQPLYSTGQLYQAINYLVTKK